MDAMAIVRGALGGTGINLVASCSIETYDQRAPRGHRAADLMPRARGVIVVGSGGGELWTALLAAAEADPSIWERPHPFDWFVGGALDAADAALALARIGSRRFEPLLGGALLAPDFRALGELTGLGTMGPFGLLIHPAYGPWWALRGSWLVDVPLPDPHPHLPPCAGCPAPCLGSSRGGEGVLLATAAVRGRCVVGQGSRYSDEQIAYHYDRDATLERLRAKAGGAPAGEGA
jgi:hypothetical protein